jgi:ATP-dependent DNA helicase RecG
VLHLPLRYEDETRLTPVAEARAGSPVQIEVEVTHRSQVPPASPAGGAASPTTAAPWSLRFFNFYPSQQKQLAAGRARALFGDMRGGFFGAEMLHPRVRSGRPTSAAARQPHPGLSDHRRSVGQSARCASHGRRRCSGSVSTTAARLAAPPYALIPVCRSGARAAPSARRTVAARMDERGPAWRRMKFDELLAQQISLRRAWPPAAAGARCWLPAAAS